MKPNETSTGDYIIGGQQSIQNKQQVNDSQVVTSEALQIILNEANLIDQKGLMLDITKLLQENANILPTQQRVIVNPNWMEGGSNGAPGPGGGGGFLPPERGTQDMGQEGIAIPKRQVYLRTTDDGLNIGNVGTSAPLQSSSYGASPQPNLIWDTSNSNIEIKEEDGYNGGQGHIYSLGSGGHIIQPVRKSRVIFNSGSVEPTLAQLNSPPNEETTLTSLNNLDDLSSLGVDLDILATELFPQPGDHHQFSEIKMEPGVLNHGGMGHMGGEGGAMAVVSAGNMFQWGKESQLSSSVPVSVISNAADFQELSNLSNGGPAISPRHLTLSPSSALSPLSPGTRTGLSPNSQPASPQLQGGSGMNLTPRSPHSSALHELLMRQDPQVPDPIRSRSNSNQFKSAKRPIAARQRNSLSISSPLLASQLSKSAPVKTLPIEQMIWSRRDPRPHMNSICSNAGDSSIADEVSEIMNSLSPSELNDIDSEDETYNKSELENDEAQMSDLDIKPDLRIDEDGEEGSSRKERYFWQYNVQAKGPKGQKLALDTKIVDPHAPIEVIDPVFSDSVQVHGIKHSGKARRGDGNDLTANPKKLAMIGKELDKINKEINNIPPVSEVPFNTRSKSRKEKNKLASRACRLKKKAQHEANKLKLQGLEEEHNDLMRSIQQVKEILRAKWTGGSVTPAGSAQPIQSHEELTHEAEAILNRANRCPVAGGTTDYVNRMIAKYS